MKGSERLGGQLGPHRFGAVWVPSAVFRAVDFGSSPLLSGHERASRRFSSVCFSSGSLRVGGSIPPSSTTSIHRVSDCIAGSVFVLGRFGVPILRGESVGKTREAVFWHYPFYPTDYPSFTPAAAIRSGRYKGIYFYEDDRFEVYDLERDVGETRDISSVAPDVANRLKTRLHSWQESVGATYPRPNPAYATAL